MNIVQNPFFRALLLPVLALGLAACDMNSVDSTSAVVSTTDGTVYNFSGLYMNSGNDSSTNGALPLVYPNESGNQPSGQAITSLRLLQYGNVLEAYDSANQTWSGKISTVQKVDSKGTANFSLQGRTTAGISVEVAGTMVYEDQQSTMDATWIEPAYYGNLNAQATVSPANTNTPIAELSLTADPASLSTGNTSQLTASGCSSTYTWKCDKIYGTFSSSGSKGYYTRTSGTSTNSETITVYCGSDNKSVTIDFN